MSRRRRPVRVGSTHPRRSPPRSVPVLEPYGSCSSPRPRPSKPPCPPWRRPHATGGDPPPPRPERPGRNLHGRLTHIRASRRWTSEASWHRLRRRTSDRSTRRHVGRRRRPSREDRPGDEWGGPNGGRRAYDDVVAGSRRAANEEHADRSTSAPAIRTMGERASSIPPSVTRPSRSGRVEEALDAGSRQSDRRAIVSAGSTTSTSRVTEVGDDSHRQLVDDERM